MIVVYEKNKGEGASIFLETDLSDCSILTTMEAQHLSFPLFALLLSLLCLLFS